MKIAIRPPSLCSQHPGRTCCMCVLCRIDSELMAACHKCHIAVLEAPWLIGISCLWFEEKVYDEVQLDHCISVASTFVVIGLFVVVFL